MSIENETHISLTKEQYFCLAKSVYLGNWMANAQRTGQEDDPHMKEYEEIADYIYSLAPQFGLPKKIEIEIEFADGDATTEASDLHEEYDEQNFWELLPDKLGERDFFRKYSNPERQAMSGEDHFMKMMECIIVWDEEFETNGIERLGVIKPIVNI